MNTAVVSGARLLLALLFAAPAAFLPPGVTTAFGTDRNSGQDDLLKQLSAEEPEELLAATIAAGKIPDPSPGVIDRLLELTLYPGTDRQDGQFVRMAAERSLGQIGDPVNARLERFLNDPDVVRVCMGILGVKALGPKAVQWLPLLKTKLAGSDDHRIKMGILFAMEPMGPLAEPLLDEMIRLLKDPEFNVQQATCRAIAAMGPMASRAAPELVFVVENGLVSARSRALVALGSIGPVEGIDTVGILTKWMTAFSVIDRERALEGLARFGAGAVSAREGVEKLMYRDDASVRPHAAFTYWKITGYPEKPLQVLGEMLGRHDDQNPALILVGAMGSVADPLIEKVAALLADEEEGLRESALIALSQMGPGVARVRDQIEQIARHDSDRLLRELAADLLKSMDASSVPDPESPARSPDGGGDPTGRRSAGQGSPRGGF